jgi:hypothetical protein
MLTCTNGNTYKGDWKVDDAEDCIALRADASALRKLSVERPDGLVDYKCAFDDDDIASLPAEEDSSDGEEDSSDGEEGQTDEEGASAAYNVYNIPAGELPDTAEDNMGNVIPGEPETEGGESNVGSRRTAAEPPQRPRLYS